MSRIGLILAVLGLIAFAVPSFQVSAEEAEGTDVAAPADDAAEEAEGEESSQEGAEGSEEAQPE